MRQVLRRIAVVLILGPVTAFAIAWVLAAFSPIPMYPRQTAGGFVRWNIPWHVNEAHRFGLIHIWWSNQSSRQQIPAGEAPGESALPRPPQQVIDELLAETREALHDRLASTGKDRVVFRNTPRRWGTFDASTPPPPEYKLGSDAGYGWPFPCLWYRIVTGWNESTASTTSNLLDDGIVLHGEPASRWDGYRVLPLRPHLAGVALNAALYAALWAALLFAPGLIRRRLRRRRGRCLRCGYDVRGEFAGRCPECGCADSL